MKRSICIAVLAVLVLSAGCMVALIGKSKRDRAGQAGEPGREQVEPAPAPDGAARPLIIVFCKDAAEPMSQHLEMHFPQASGWNQFEFQGKELVVRDNGDYVKLVSGRGLIKYGTVGIALHGRDVAVRSRFLPRDIRMIAVLADGSLAAVRRPEPVFPERKD